jgi:eukaryotic-like serine/threonine-protein kinase
VEPAAECSECGRIGPDVAERCACGSPRRQAPVPAVIAGKFRVDYRVGAGGMGVVYKGHDRSLNRPIALKTLTRLSPHAAERLGYEAQMMASVVHPHLATIYSLERWRGTPILVEEFLEGGTLSLRLRRGPQPLADVLQLGVALASALQHLHRNGVLHRDVKPSNIGFSGDGVPKLLDFGLASLLSSPPPGGSRFDATGDGEPRATQSIAIDRGVIAGTPLYLSPEAARGHDTHVDFDVWGLAIVLYEAIAGAHPFAAPTVSEILDRVRATAVPDLRRFRSDCPDPVARGFGLMLAPNRNDRPRTATALHEMLQTLMRGDTPRP